MFVGLAMAVALAGSPVIVEKKQNFFVREVSFSDLRLDSGEGERALNQRVAGAIEALCTDAVGPYDSSFEYRIGTMRCHKRAWNEARPQMGRAMSQARELARNGSAASAATITIAASR